MVDYFRGAPAQLEEVRQKLAAYEAMESAGSLGDFTAWLAGQATGGLWSPENLVGGAGKGASLLGRALWTGLSSASAARYHRRHSSEPGAIVPTILEQHIGSSQRPDRRAAHMRAAFAGATSFHITPRFAERQIAMQYSPSRSFPFNDTACFDPVMTAGPSAASTAVSAAGTLAGGGPLVLGRPG